MSLAKLLEIGQCLIGPWIFLSISLKHLFITIWTLVVSGNFDVLLSPSRFQDAWFGSFWAEVGPQVKQVAEARVVPLLEGRIRNGHVLDEPVMPPVSGRILEIGAGSGMWADVLARFRDGGSGAPQTRSQKKGGLTKIYGVEPNPKSAAALRQRVKAVGIDDIYEVVPVGIESLNDQTAWGDSIEPGSIDSIVSILCMCSIPEPEKNIRLLASYLRKGGKWYVFEHVKSHRGGPLMRLYQRFLNCIWPTAIGGCRLCRETGKTLANAAEWTDFDLASPEEEPTYSSLPHVVGVLTK